MGIEEAFPYVVFRVLGIPIQDVVIQTWIMMAILIPLAYVAGRKVSIHPSRWQHLLETGVEFIDNLIAQRVKRQISGLFELLATLMLYVAVANLLGLIPVLRAPTRSVNTTIALSIVSFLAVHYFGFRERGMRRHMRGFVEPVVLMLPLNILGQISRAFAMALRLFGNVIAGEMIGLVMLKLAMLLAPLGDYIGGALGFVGIIILRFIQSLIPLPFGLLSMITGVLQALVFTFLTVTFVADAVGQAEETE